MTRLTYAQCYASFLTAVREGNVHHAVTALTYAGGRWPGKTEDWPRFAVVDIWRERQAECIARMALMTWTWGRRNLGNFP